MRPHPSLLYDYFVGFCFESFHCGWDLCRGRRRQMFAVSPPLQPTLYNPNRVCSLVALR